MEQVRVSDRNEYHKEYNGRSLLAPPSFVYQSLYHLFAVSAVVEIHSPHSLSSEYRCKNNKINNLQVQAIIRLISSFILLNLYRCNNKFQSFYQLFSVSIDVSCNNKYNELF
jgi:hypothetical protein